MTITIQHKGETKTATAETWEAALDDMVQRLGAWVPNESKVIRETSTFETQVLDTQARERIEQQHAALADAGVSIDTSDQLYATGTRMAESGYKLQAARAAEHAAKAPIREAAAALIERVRSERRHDVEVSAGELGKALAMNGALTFDGLKLREQAVRGILGRIGSPALGYVLGARSDRGSR